MARAGRNQRHERASAPEGASVEVTVSLSQAPEREVTVPIVATRGANLAADEYEGVPASVTFAADVTEAPFTVTFADDAVVEGNETLTLTFGTFPDGNVTLGMYTRLVLTVVDDDGPPAAPDVAVQTGDGFAALSWAPVPNDSPVLRYEVRWRVSDGGTFGTPLDVGLETSYRVEGLTNGTPYEFEVRAVNAHGNGESASAPGTPTARITGIPRAVQWLRVNATDSGRAELKWGRPSNGTDRVTRPGDGFAQIQGYRIEVCRTTCSDEANWYAVVPNTRKFEHKYVHQVLAPGVIRENRYRVQAININGKTGPWSNVGRLEATVLERFWLVSPNSSTVDVHLEVWHPDGNPLYVRYADTSDPMSMRYAEQRLTQKGYPVIGLPVQASTHYRVEVDFVNTFDSPRLRTATVSYTVLRDESFAVTGGDVDKARRVDGRNDLREIHIEPKGWDDVRVTLAGGRACGTEGAICTADNKVLANTEVAVVPGPLALSVADASATEGTDAALEFAVTLNRAASGTVTVDYATGNGTATAGADYTAASDTLTFDPGETAKTVNVAVLDDAHDDTEETLTLTLSNASGAQIRDGEATGTIVNSDPLPQAWLARFGRTVADHVVDAVSGRLEGSADGGSHVTLGGRRLALDGAGGAGPEAAARRGTGDGEAEVHSWERGHLARMDTGGPAATGSFTGLRPGRARCPRFGDASRKAWPDCNDAGASRSPGDDWMHARDGHGTRIMAGRELLLGSAFHLTHGGEADGTGGASTRWTAWGRAAASSFDGEADGLSVDGDVTTFTFGADAARGRWLGGVALAHSTGEGGFRDHADTEGHDDRRTGTLESTLTSVHPYLRFEVSERLSTWGILGYGSGDLTLMVDAAGDTPRKTWKTDTSMWMTAAGARGVLLSAADHDGFELAARGEARLVGMRSEAVTDAATGADGAGQAGGDANPRPAGCASCSKARTASSWRAVSH